MYIETTKENARANTTIPKDGRLGVTGSRQNRLRAIDPITNTATETQSNSDRISPGVARNPRTLFAIEMVASKKTESSGAIIKEKRRLPDTPYTDRNPGRIRSTIEHATKQKKESHI